MPASPGSWLAGWPVNSYVTAAEFQKGWGCFYDYTVTTTDASLAITVPTWGASLRFEYQARGDTAATAVSLWLRLNGDTGATYDRQTLQSESATTTSARTDADTKLFLPAIAGSTSAAGASGSGEFFIPNYRGTTFWKTVAALGMSKADTSGATSFYGIYNAGAWRNTAAVTTVTILPATGNLVTGSRVRGYVTG